MEYMGYYQNIDKWLTLKPETTALLVIDMQVDFLSPHGKAAKRGKQLIYTQSIADKVNLFARKLKKMGVLVIFTKFVSSQEFTPKNLRTAIEKEGFDLPCVKGSGGEDLFGVEVPKGAKLIEKPHYDAFLYTDLGKILSEKSIKNVLITGVRTEVCVDTTAKRAAGEGYNTIIVSDLVATYDDRKVIHDEILDFFHKYFGFVLDSRSVLEALEQK